MCPDINFIKTVLPEATIIGTSFSKNSHFVIDSRDVKQDDIFICLKGAKHDGHSFIAQAIERGATGIIAHKDKKSSIEQLDVFSKQATFIFVEDALEALQQLASAWRAQFTYPVIGISGSVGKTSTKYIISHIINQVQKHFFISHGNQNTLIGVSLNILRMRPEHEGAVFEIGINKRGEMARIAKVLRPTSALITNVGHCHMEGLGSLHDIALEKRDIFSCFTEHNIGIINGDQPLLSHVSYHYPVIRFGTKTTNQIQARKIRIKGGQTSFLLKMYQKKFSIIFNHPHAGIIMNVLAASSIAYLLDIPEHAIIKGIQIPLSIEGRFECRPLKRIKGSIIHDSYNANPESMKAALLAFEQLSVRGKKIAVIGDMLELGTNGPFWHRQIGRFLRKISSLDTVILVGSMVEWIKKTAPVSLTIEQVSSWQQAVEKVQKVLNKDSLVLVKGSRAMGLSNLVHSFSE